MKKISIIIPCYNEEKNIPLILEKFSKIINREDLINRKISLTKMLLIHGDQDEVVAPNFLLEAKDFLIRLKCEVETKMIKNCGHQIPIEASSHALMYIKNNFKI